MCPKRILVVEDDWELSTVLLHLLEDEGYRGRYAANGKIALIKLAELPADLVLTDYMMPVMDGCELAQRIRAKKDLAATPVVMMSALPESFVQSRCGMHLNAILQKPFHYVELLDRLEKLLAP